jgi:hypothetical protein
MADFFVGQGLTAAELRNRTKDILAGQYRDTAALATSGTTEQVYATSQSTDLLAETTYRVTAECYFLNSVDGDDFSIRIRDTNISGSIENGVVIKGRGGGPYTIRCTYTFETVGAETGVLWVATILRLTGTGTATVDPDSFIDVERKGDSGIYTTI